MQAALRVARGWSPGALDGALERELRALAPESRGELLELVRGSIRARGALDHLLSHHLRRPGGLDRLTREALRLGAYRLLYLDRVPPYAAVDGAVRLVKGPRRKLVNGVLRSLERRIAARRTEPGEASYELPLPDGRVVRFVDRAFAGLEPAARMAARHSLPAWLVERWRAELADDDALERRCAACNARPGLSLRVNPGRGSREAAIATLGEAGAQASPHPDDPQAIQLADAGAGELTALPGFDAGDWAVQDVASIRAGALAPADGESVLELAAAPGGKSAQLLEANPARRLLATDLSPGRMRRLRENLARLGHADRAALVAADGARLPLAREQRFAGVFADVPCSNTGVLARRADARWRLQPEHLAELSALQRELLDAACARVAPGGWLVYSTCSLEPEENQRQVEAALGRWPDFELRETRWHRPETTPRMSGGFAALLRRAAQPME